MMRKPLVMRGWGPKFKMDWAYMDCMGTVIDVYPSRKDFEDTGYEGKPIRLKITIEEDE